MDFAILAGGAGKRLGMEKATLPFGRTTLLEWVINRLGTKNVIVVKKRETDIPDIEGVRVIEDLEGKKGALTGIRTALLASKNEHCFVFACDMPFISRELIEGMLSLKRGYDALVPYHKKGIEPLHSIYSKKCLKAVDEGIAHGDFSIHSLLKRVNVRYMQADLYCDPEVAFMNINTKEDYERAIRVFYSNKMQEGLSRLQESPVH